LGQWLHIKRIEANLTQLDVCRYLRVGERRVLAWERDVLKPSVTEWESLRNLLKYDSGIPQPGS